MRRSLLPPLVALIGLAALAEGQVWQQGCAEGDFGGQTDGQFCGERPAAANGEAATQSEIAAHYEFPWTCMVFTRNRREGEGEGDEQFVGTCVIIPDHADNNMTGGATRVIMTLSRMMQFAVQRGGDDTFFGPREVIVRVVQYDEAGKAVTRDHLVRRFRSWSTDPEKKFDPPNGLVGYNMHTMWVQEPIDLTGGKANPACLPQCQNMFDFTFSNGTGTNCWVTGWEREPNTKEGAPSYVQKKIQVPLVKSDLCQAALRASFRKQGRTGFYQISESEMCAQDSERQCKGDGGGALVCQAQPSGRWYVVGLVSYGAVTTKCGDPNLPAVYTNVYNMVDHMVKNDRFEE